MPNNTISPVAGRGVLEELVPGGALADAERARRAGAVLHEAVAFSFKAHPRFFAAAAFVWPSATWSFGGHVR